MNPKLLRYYSQELQHLREVGGEFATEFPKIAGRLGMEGMECADPYVDPSDLITTGAPCHSNRVECEKESCDWITSGCVV